MTSTLVAGLLAAFVATTLAAALGRAPTRKQCPACGGPTSTIRPHAWVEKRVPGARLRWCPACAWQGWGRHGPELKPGHPVSHDSGFNWGDDRMEEDFGFRFNAPSAEAAPVEPPHHASGFRFSAPPIQDRPAAHPSGFSWSEGEEPDTTDAPAPPAGFQWADPQSAPAARFAWRRRDRTDTAAESPKGFGWKDTG